MSFHDRLKRFARKNKGIVCNDPEGVLATLQIANRLFKEGLSGGNPITVVQAVDRALPLAAPKCQHKARGYVLSILIRNTGLHTSPLAILTDSIAAQGRVNRLQKRGPQA